MNLEALRTEFQARGFGYLSSSRSNAYLNSAYLLDICEVEDWPFLEASTSGEAPLTVSDLRSVESVIDTTQLTKLKPIDRRQLTDLYDVDLTTAGSPAFYYLSGETVVSVYPTATDTISVRYWKAPAELSGTDTPVIPTRFHSLIIDFAVARAYEDSDDYELAQNARENALTRLQEMRISLLGQNRDLPAEFIAVVDPGTNA